MGRQTVADRYKDEGDSKKSNLIRHHIVEVPGEKGVEKDVEDHHAQDLPHA